MPWVKQANGVWVYTGDSNPSGGTVVAGSTDENPNMGSGWNHSITNAYCDNLHRNGKIVEVKVHASAYTTYNGTLYILNDGGWYEQVDTGTNVNGVSLSGYITRHYNCPGPFTDRTVSVRFKGYDRQGSQSSSNYDIYANPHTGSIADPMYVKIYLNPNGGSGETTTVYARYGESLGDPPEPTRAGYKFLGWFTDSSAGTEIKAEDNITFTEETMLYAHWELQTVFHLIQNGSEILAPLVYIVENEQATQAVGLYVVENETAYQCI